MIEHLKQWVRTVGIASAIFVLPLPAAAQPIDPALAASWAFMQSAMPGVPYSLLKAACSEGTVMIYHGTWTIAQRNQIEHFTQRFPCIKVQRFELTAGPLRERFMSETRAGRYIADIIQDTDPGSLDNAARTGMLMNYVISNDSSYAGSLKMSGYWYPLRVAIITIVWNTTVVTEEEAKLLTDWKSAINPIWKGRMAVQHPTGGGAAYSPWYAWVKLYGEDFVRKIGALRPRVFNGMNPAASALASGDVGVMFGASETPLPQLWEKGAPLRWTMPEPAIGPTSGQGISAKAPHPNAAKLYQEYAFTLEGYQQWQRFGGPPARIGYKDQRKVASESWYKYPTNFFPYDSADATKSMERIVDLFNKAVGGAR